jgi:hypothetical protein
LKDQQEGRQFQAGPAERSDKPKTEHGRQRNDAEYASTTPTNTPKTNAADMHALSAERHDIRVYRRKFSCARHMFLDRRFVMSVADEPLPTKHWTAEGQRSGLIPDFRRDRLHSGSTDEDLRAT